MQALRHIGLAGTTLSRACVNTMNLRLLKTGAVVTAHVRRAGLAMCSACADHQEFIGVFHALHAAARLTAATNQSSRLAIELIIDRLTHDNLEPSCEKSGLGGRPPSDGPGKHEEMKH